MIFFFPLAPVSSPVSRHGCLCAVRLWEWVHRLEFSHWRCQLALGDGKRAWVGSAVTSCSSRTFLPPSHFVSRYFSFLPPLSESARLFLSSSSLLCSCQPIAYFHCLFIFFSVLPTVFISSPLVPQLLLCHFVWEPSCLIIALGF